MKLERGSRSADGGDEAPQREVLREQMIARSLGELHELKQRLGQGATATTGIRDVLAALVRGQVDTLYLDGTAAADFEVRLEDYPGLALGAVVPTGPVKADRALLAAACLTDAQVVMTRTSTLGGAPVAAILRWDQETQGDTA